MRARLAATIPQLAAATLLAVLAGCAPTGPTPSPGRTDGAITGPSANAPTAVPTVTAPSATFGADTMFLAETVAVTIVVDRLPVRVDPSPSAPSPGAFVRGDVAVLWVFEPVLVDGSSWYYLIAVPTAVGGKLPDLPTVLPASEFPLTGWVAARDGSAETVSKLPPRCPAERNFANVSAMLPGERAECFGADQLTLDGTFTCDGCTDQDSPTWEPEWLAGYGGGRLSEPAAQDGASLAVHFPPSVAVPEEDARVRVTGHFDDPLATTCRIVEQGVLTPQGIATEVCRQQFVVESFEPVSVEEIPPPE